MGAVDQHQRLARAAADPELAEITALEAEQLAYEAARAADGRPWSAVAVRRRRRIDAFKAARVAAKASARAQVDASPAPSDPSSEVLPDGSAASRCDA